MNYFLRINLYEIQAILYWILGEIILHFGNIIWLGWSAIIFGWLTFITTLVITIRHKEELKKYFNEN